MVHRISQPDDILIEAQKLYPKKFHEVSESSYMDDVYRKAAIMCGIREHLKATRGDVNAADIAGGSGRQGRIIRSLVKEDSGRVVIHNVDIGRKEFRRGRGDERTIGDVMHLPLPDKSMDFVFMNNIPIPLSHVKYYVINMKDETGKKEQILEMLENAIDAQYKLNLLEGIRVLKENGVMMLSGKHVGQTGESIQRNLDDLPLKVDKFEVVELESGVVPLWRKYGIDIEKPTFMIVSLRKTGDAEGLVDFYEQMRYTSLEQLLRIEEFDKVLEEMRKAKA